MENPLIIEVFKSGEQTDSSGRTRNWTLDDLDTMVNKYNNQNDSDRHEAPVVIGHPETDSPAYGWVKSLSRKGNVLFAELKDLSDEFVALLKKGSYKKRSISLFSDLMLKHVGFLGGAIPAVKGLSDPVLANYKNANTNDLLIYEFATEGKDDAHQEPVINQNNKNFNSEEKKMDKKDDAPQSKDIVKQIANEVKDQFGDEVAQQLLTILNKYKGSINAKPEKADKEDKEDPKFNEFKQTAEYQAMLKMMADSDAKIKLLEKENLKKDNEAYFNKQKEEGYLLPKQKEIVMQTLEAAATNTAQFNFNNADNFSLTELIKGLISSFGKQVSFSEFANAGGNQQDDAEDKALTELVAQFNERRS